MVRRAFPWDPGALFLGLSKWQPGTFEILANSLASWGPRGWEGGDWNLGPMDRWWLEGGGLSLSSERERRGRGRWVYK